MARKKKMSPAQKAAVRWEDPANESATGQNDTSNNSSSEDAPVNGDHFVISIVLILVVAVAAMIYASTQGGF